MSAITSELFIAGKRSDFQQLAADIEQMRAGVATADDLIKIEDFRTQPRHRTHRMLLSYPRGEGQLRSQGCSS